MLNATVRKQPCRSRFLGSVGALLIALGGKTLPAQQTPPAATAGITGLELLRPSEDGSHFVGSTSGRKVVLWGVNYDHDASGRLLEEYWESEWDTLASDFREIKQLGANVVRIHLQLAEFMQTSQDQNESNLNRLAKLIRLAEETGLYLDITGLGCYHKENVPQWYDELDESDRWDVQARFWKSVAKVCRDSPAVYCYNLMNEPVLPGKEPEAEWLAGKPLGGKYFVQRIALDLAGRTRVEVARAWVKRLTTTIREVDDQHLITVGVIPWAQVFKGAKPIFYSPEVSGMLDVVSVHFYPKAGEVPAALEALRVYNIGKPLVIEEIFPLKASIEEVDEFIAGSREFTDGWISFYWGQSVDDNVEKGDLAGALMAKWLRYFQANSPHLPTE